MLCPGDSWNSQREEHTVSRVLFFERTHKRRNDKVLLWLSGKLNERGMRGHISSTQQTEPLVELKLCVKLYTIKVLKLWEEEITKELYRSWLTNANSEVSCTIEIDL